MKIKDSLPGIVVVLVIAAISYSISTFHASFDALVISIIIGMFLGNMLGVRNYFEKGIEVSIKIFLPIGISLYGTQLIIDEMKLTLIATIVMVFSGLFVLTIIVSRIFDINKKLSVLLASGLSVCGASAIAIISPLIDARRVDTSISVISVMMLGLTGMILYPILNEILSLTHEEVAFFTGTTLPMLGQVKVASGTISQECLHSAVKLKLIRISLLFFLITIAIFVSGKQERKVKVPWFIIVFVALAVLVNITGLFVPLLNYFGIASSFFLSATLAAIGFSVDFDAIVEQGITPLVVIFISWSVMIMMIYIVGSLI